MDVNHIPTVYVYGLPIFIPYICILYALCRWHKNRYTAYIYMVYICRYVRFIFIYKWLNLVTNRGRGAGIEASITSSPDHKLNTYR